MLFLGFLLIAPPIDLPLVLAEAIALERSVALPMETPNPILNINSNGIVM
jgi:hypothetical protein